MYGKWQPSKRLGMFTLARHGLVPKLHYMTLHSALLFSGGHQRSLAARSSSYWRIDTCSLLYFHLFHVYYILTYFVDCLDLVSFDVLTVWQSPYGAVGCWLMASCRYRGFSCGRDWNLPGILQWPLHVRKEVVQQWLSTALDELESWSRVTL